MLRQRAVKEVAAEQALALANNDYNRHLNLLEGTRKRLEAAITIAEKDELDVFEIMHLLFYRASLTKKINDQEEDVSKAAFVVENKRSEAVQARQERQVIEKLKDKHLQNYRREMEAREQKEVDEIALYTYQRNMNNLQPR